MSYALYFILLCILVYWVESPYALFPNMLNLRQTAGPELEVWLKNFHLVQKQEVKQKVSLPQYKFYSSIAETLLEAARKVGGSYQGPMLFLREGLQLDLQFEKRLREAVLGVWLQLGLMMVLTWTFIFMALHLVDVHVAAIKLLLILFWQLIGIALLPLLLRYFRKKYFGEIGVLWRILFILRSLEKIPLSRSEILAFAGVQELKDLRQKSLAGIVEKLKDICQKALKLGVSYEDDVRYLMDELRFTEKWHFELFEKRLTVIKLGLLSLFFLPSYLAFIFLLLGDLMAFM